MNCQIHHGEDHRLICRATRDHSDQNSKQSKGDRKDPNDYLTPKELKIVSKLVARKFHVLYKVNGIEKELLLDTGAQVSIVSDSQFKGNCLESQVRDVTEIMGEWLQLRTANGTTSPYKGWTSVICTMGKGSAE